MSNINRELNRPRPISRIICQTSSWPRNFKILNYNSKMIKKFLSRLVTILSSTLLLFGLGACSTSLLWSNWGHLNKDWVLQPARSVDQQNIVYVSSASGVSNAAAEFVAVSKALEDLANECSYTPKGTHLEDRVESKQVDQFVVAVKLVVSIKNCDQAKKDVVPEDIQQNANRGYADQIQKYQLEKTPNFIAQIPNVSVQSALVQQTEIEKKVIHDDAEFFELRQKIALIKQSFILNANMSSLNLKQSLENLKEELAATQLYEEANPALKSSSLTWSKVQLQITERQKALVPEKLARKGVSKSKRSHRQPAQSADAARSKSGLVSEIK